MLRLMLCFAYTHNIPLNNLAKHRRMQWWIGKWTKRKNKKIWWFFEYIKNAISIVTIVIEEKTRSNMWKILFKYYSVLMSGYREYKLVQTSGKHSIVHIERPKMYIQLELIILILISFLIISSHIWI